MSEDNATLNNDAETGSAVDQISDLLFGSDTPAVTNLRRMIPNQTIQVLKMMRNQ